MKSHIGRYYHAFDERLPKHNSWVLTHCLEETDDNCWCEPEKFVECEHCDFDEDEEETPYIRCHHCKDTGLIELDDADDLDDDMPILLVHRDR